MGQQKTYAQEGLYIADDQTYIALAADTNRQGGQLNSYWQKKLANNTCGSMGGLFNAANPASKCVSPPSSDAASPSQCCMTQQLICQADIVQADQIDRICNVSGSISNPADLA